MGTGWSRSAHPNASTSSPGRLPEAEILPVQTDLAAADGVDTVWTAVETAGSPLRVSALNAGVSLGGAFLDTDLDDELRLLALNVTSQVTLAKRVVRAMSEQRRGHILITSSLSALTPTPYESIYGPSRAFMYSFAQGLREELKTTGIVVTALLPRRHRHRVPSTRRHAQHHLRHQRR